MGTLADITDRLTYRVRTMAGLCKTVDIDDIADFLEKGEQYSSRAAALGNFMNIDSRSVSKMEEASEKLGKLRKAVDTGKKVCADLDAVNEISDALRILNQWSSGEMDRNDPRAAAAFGDLFHGAGHFASKLPPPANQYAKLLMSCGTFFVDMQRLMDPDNRSIGGGRKLKDLKYDGSD